MELGCQKFRQIKLKNNVRVIIYVINSLLS